MERWAKDMRYASSVRFLCVCLDSVRVAQHFGQMFNFQNVVSCHIPSREYFPRNYGQLGCSGFIVADKRGCFVSRKTRAYLQYGDAAFSHVEELLNKQLGFNTTSVPASICATATSNNEGETTEVVPVPSVGVESMDNEHASCEEALAVLLRTNSVPALERVMTELVDHFNHEEHVMKAHKFGRAEDLNDVFSPFKSHCKDHERILDIGFRALSQANSTSIACGPTGAATGQGS
jgi:hypothetical protein